MTELERTNDDLGTPRWFVDILRQLGTIDLDPCSNPWSTVGALIEISAHRGGNGLKRSWAEFLTRGSRVFVNPPYSNPKPWCERIVEAADADLEIVALLKLDPSTEWARMIAARRDAKCDFDRRISFDGGKHSAGKMASTAAYFGPRPYLFCHLFQGHGEVRVYDRRRAA
jgi:hypothetical protein